MTTTPARPTLTPRPTAPVAPGARTRLPVLIGACGCGPGCGCGCQSGAPCQCGGASGGCCGGH
ncbi:hypothetical protein OG455_22400 [Kitasatospora sp. NBC_01287]|uniref:hypothetical protein n=1 Tax=Kitasatospora sp. NBC_01287 TaxID=2903573 RepID=UPI00224E734E|nr:hypothetical protein [Kitasatospora sp. NBC_01287]MCX4748231.1 hypothetical protein [Kitasatospora sp. NBC_01287]